jgi:hypothetical protein
MLVILQRWCQRQGTSSSLRHANCGPGHIQCNYSTAYSGFNKQQNASAPLSEISPQCNVRYTATLVPITVHILRFTLCERWSRTYTMHIQASIFIWTYLRYYWIYLDNSKLVNLQSWCPIQRTSSGIRSVNCRPGHIQCIYSSAYLGFKIRL